MALDLEALRSKEKKILEQIKRPSKSLHKRKSLRPWQSFEKEKDLFELILERKEKILKPKKVSHLSKKTKSSPEKVQKEIARAKELARKILGDL